VKTGRSLVDIFLTDYGYAAVFAFIGIESMGIPFPGETMLITAALYAGATHHLSIGWVIAAAAAGAIAGDNIGFGVGHWAGYRALLRWGRYIRLHEGRIKLARYLFALHGGKVVFFGRFISVLRTYAAFLAGTARMPWLRFLIFNAAGGIAWAMLYGLGAYALGDRINQLEGTARIALAAVGVVVVVATVLLLRHHEKRLSAQAELAMPGPLTAP
jgi:membrane protein DedA with SNARE-associated domain